MSRSCKSRKRVMEGRKRRKRIEKQREHTERRRAVKYKEPGAKR